MEEMPDHIEVTALLTWAPFHFQAWHYVLSNASKGSVTFTDPDTAGSVIGRVVYHAHPDTAKVAYDVYVGDDPSGVDLTTADFKSAALHLLHGYYGFIEYDVRVRL